MSITTQPRTRGTTEKLPLTSAEYGALRKVLATVVAMPNLWGRNAQLSGHDLRSTQRVLDKLQPQN
jgi:hypothetical protein